MGLEDGADDIHEETGCGFVLHTCKCDNPVAAGYSEITYPIPSAPQNKDARRPACSMPTNKNAPVATTGLGTELMSVDVTRARSDKQGHLS